MKKSVLPLGAALVIVAGCGLPEDQGVVMGCFGLVNETIRGDGRLFRSGRDEHVLRRLQPRRRRDADHGACDADGLPGPGCAGAALQHGLQGAAGRVQGCASRSGAAAELPDAVREPVRRPARGRVGFAVGGMAFQAGRSGGHALHDDRFGDDSINGVSQGAVPATGIVDGTMPCAANQSCVFTLSRLDVVASRRRHHSRSTAWISRRPSSRTRG